MARTLFAFGLVAMLAVTTGCRMCDHPYDNCGPVWSGSPCRTCNRDYRAGSVLSAGAQGAAPDMIHDSSPGPERATGTPTRAVRAAADNAGTPAKAIAPKTGGSSKGAVSKKDVRPAPPGTREGTTKVLSVEDRKVENDEPGVSETPAPAASAGTDGAVTEDPPAPPEPPKIRQGAARPSRTTRW